MEQLPVLCFGNVASPSSLLCAASGSSVLTAVCSASCPRSLHTLFPQVQKPCPGLAHLSVPGLMPGPGSGGQLPSVSLLLLAPVRVTIPVSLGLCAFWRWMSRVLANVSVPSNPDGHPRGLWPRGLPEQRASSSLMLRGQEGETGHSERGWGIRSTCGPG